MARKLTLVFLALLAALFMGGCVTVESQTARQVDVLGPVEVETVVAQCLRTSGDPNGPCEDDRTRKQLLLAFQVPAAFTPPAEFDSTAGPAMTMRRLDSYGSELERLMPSPAGRRWVGYGSAGTFLHTPEDPVKRTFAARFGLPSGSPFTGSFSHVSVAGARQVGRRGVSDTSTPVACGADPTELTGDYSTQCVTSIGEPKGLPPAAELPVRDLAVAAGPRAYALPGRRATVRFDLKLSGPPSPEAFALGAATSLPGAAVAPASPAVLPVPGASTPTTVDVSVPGWATPGTYDVALTASLPNGQRRSATAKLTVSPIVMKPLGFATRTVRLRRNGTASFVVMCPVRASVNCAGELALKSGRTRLGRTRFDVAPGKDARLRMRLSRRARRAFRGRRHVRARATMVMRDITGQTATNRSRLTIRARAR
jgi:hypothetical protein